MIFLTGDTHCPIDIHKLSSSNWCTGKELTKNDYLIILGDAGFLWNNSASEKYWIEWISNKPWTTLFCDGNHENHLMLKQLPVIKMFDGNVGKITDSLYYLKRGEVYTIENKKFFVMGGAYSVDKNIRHEGIDWWKEEQPSYVEYEYGFNNLEKHNWCVDYILSHTCPIDVIPHLCSLANYEIYDRNLRMDNVTQYLQEVTNKTKFKKHYFGHWHLDLNFIFKENKYQAMYYKIEELNDE